MTGDKQEQLRSKKAGFEANFKSGGGGAEWPS